MGSSLPIEFVAVIPNRFGRTSVYSTFFNRPDFVLGFGLLKNV